MRADIHKSPVKPERRYSAVGKDPAVVVGRDVLRRIHVRDVIYPECHAHLPGDGNRDIRVGDPPRLVLLIESRVSSAAGANLAEACGVESNVETADRVVECRAEGCVGLAFLDP